MSGASAADIRHHYDLGDDFYALWLDPTRTYSCARWDGPDDTLEAAQLRKLDQLAAAAHAPAGGRVLDVGCGWGSMLRRLVERHGVGHAAGLTLSDAQAASIAAWADDRHTVHVESWAEHAPRAPYDAIVSIGAFEHFADYGVAREQRVEAYRAFFERCRQWLPPGGRLVLQTIAKGGNVRIDRRTLRDAVFVTERIFRGSELPWPSEILQASERRFEVVRVRNDAEDYRRTTQAWLDRLVARRAEAQALVGGEAVADYERYLDASARSFANGHLALMRIVLARV
ncbi:MAG TPA: cyclopropane-fatty-acyl-phospholipid synthase family protein [Conexibacter sp.]|nr:cyclopropane-fatty-acyl-phospholipid synthase family protein [Conexibacter sp.]